MSNQQLPASHAAYLCRAEEVARTLAKEAGDILDGNVADAVDWDDRPFHRVGDLAEVMAAMVQARALLERAVERVQFVLDEFEELAYRDAQAGEGA